MALEQHHQIVLVAYFLSRCGSVVAGRRSPGPPDSLRAPTWERAYAMFYGRLGRRRTYTAFRNSLKNARDDFDSHLGSGRIGWRAKGFEGTQDRPPRRLTKQKQDVIVAWAHRSDAELWEEVRHFIDASVLSIDDMIISDLAGELDPGRPAIAAKTEGGKRVVVSVRAERDPSLRAAAIKLYGTTCAVCGFSFGAMYGVWGQGFAVVHHLEPFGGNCPIGERRTNPETDLVVLCANCHCMVHRKKNIVLTVEELKAKLLAASK
jgi:5-methylcytosine-specific restriction protein A